MKSKYIDLMEKALSAYSDEHILKYFNDVKQNGLTEHGFPRLTANIGILISYGRRVDLLSIFIEMMDFCCETIPNVKAANDFSVREIICCMREVERAGIVSKEKLDYWRKCFMAIDPEKCYNQFAKTPTDYVRNVALFTGVSEYFRMEYGIGGDINFIELQLLQQLQWFDENCMYCDNAYNEMYQHAMYDLAPRGLYSLILNEGYRGKHYHAIDEILKKAGLITLDMQSPNGECAFGGRSNQFVHCEAWMIAIFEFEAKRYVREGNIKLAKRFKAASARAFAVIESWLNKTPIRHIKNRFPTQTQFGCEYYAYFDKYMITVASNLYAAYLIYDDSIEFDEELDHYSCVAETSKYFHRFFMKAGGYGLQFDLDADPDYDANGLGRVHLENAPSTICMSCPCPAHPKYVVDIEKPFAFSLCSAIPTIGGWCFGAEEQRKYKVIESKADKDSAQATLLCSFDNENAVYESYFVDKNGVSVSVKGNGKIGYALPAFCFDGEIEPKIIAKKNFLEVYYNGWVCRYTTNGEILNLNKVAANRNGRYQVYLATAPTKLNVKIEINKI